jgi:hypothetical protein
MTPEISDRLDAMIGDRSNPARSPNLDLGLSLAASIAVVVPRAINAPMNAFMKKYASV